MKNYFSFSIILILIVYIFSQNEEESIREFYTGKAIPFNKTNNGEASVEDDDCQCDISSSCDYLCCCDEDCPQTAKGSWSNYLKCIDQKDTLGIFADRCIDKNLVIYSNERRGLHRQKQTEDISGLNEIIENYCYSMDNSRNMIKDILLLNELEKKGFIKIEDDTLESISNIYIEDEFKKRGFDNDGSEAESLRFIDEVDNTTNKTNNISEANSNIKNIFINYKNPNFTYFQRAGEYFSLYSGSNCRTSKNIEIWKSENYSCSMDKSIYINRIILDNITLFYNQKEGNKTEKKNIPCEIKDIYFIDDYGLFNYKSLGNSSNIPEDIKILEVEFLMQIEKLKIDKCFINFVYSNIANQTSQNYIFKNSIIFSQNGKIPYRKSGNGGYLNNFPLKIYDNKTIFNEYYIVGRDKNGNCRTDENFYNYLYNYDKPIYFNQDYSYSCTLNGARIENTTLFNKLNQIKKIAKYGSSSYKNIDSNNTDWLDINDKLNKSCNHFIMNIYIDKKKTGLYSHKYIYHVDIISKNEANIDSLIFDVKYRNSENVENNEKKYKKTRSVPLFIPRIPDDLLDPLIYSDVDK